MEIKYVKGDATAPIGTGNKIIVHVCNNIGGWGKGFVMAISAKWKEPEKQYRIWFNSKQNFQLGETQLVKVDDNIWVANMIGQEGINRNKYKKPPVRYEAISKAISHVADFAITNNASIHMPRIGCGLAGGTWDKMEPIIIEQLASKNISVTVYDF